MSLHIIINGDMMKFNIKEIFDDIYRLAEEEGYLTGVCECFNDTYELEYNYHENILEICSKYIPDYEKYLPEQYYDEDTNWEQKGKILSDLTEEVFREIIY